MSRYVSVITFFWIICFLYRGNAQNNEPILERKLSITFVKESGDVVLNKIAAAAGFQFSYSPSAVDISGTYSGRFTNATVREVLDKTFLSSISYKEKGEYLILFRKKVSASKAERKPEFIFSGYVRDTAGIAIPWASIYDKQSLESTVSNEYGFYKIRFYEKQLPLDLYFSKQNYLDTIINLNSSSPAFNNISLRNIEIQTSAVTNIDSIELSAERTVTGFFNSLERPDNSKNISDTIYKKWQASVLPFIGTNGRLSGNVINDYSFNLLGGYSQGVRKAELSGVINFVRGDVQHVHLAGFANVVGGNLDGVQLAGFGNVVGKDVNAFQASGFMNINFKKFKGVQASGFLNLVGDTVSGVQLAGFSNVAMKSVNGTQLAGFCNVSLDTINGTQLAFANYAKHLNGNQIGILNISQSAEGVPVGLISYVHNGYHKLEVSTDEVFYINVALRTGVKSFHNILTSGISPSNDSLQLWNFGYGIGTSITLSNKIDLDFDLTTSQIVKGNDVSKINLLTKVCIGTDIHLSKQFSLFTGVTVNGQLTKTNYDAYPEIFTYYEPNIFYNHTWELDKTNIKMWFGGKIGLRFF